MTEQVTKPNQRQTIPNKNEKERTRNEQRIRAANNTSMDSIGQMQQPVNWDEGSSTGTRRMMWLPDRPLSL